MSLYSVEFSRGLWNTGADCIKDETTGRWYDGGLEAALFAWGDPLDGVDLEVLSRLLDIVWGECARCSHVAFIPYRVVIAFLLDVMGHGIRVPVAMRMENLQVSSMYANAQKWPDLVAPAAEWMRQWHEGAATRIQRHWRGRRGRLACVWRKAAIRRIQRGCHAWIMKPVTADGKEGINVRLLVGMGV